MKYISILLLITFSSISCKKETKKDIETQPEKFSEKPVIYNGKHCFYSEIENNKLLLEAVIDEDKISGNYDYITNNKSNSKGIFSGTITNNIATTVCEFTQNGKKQKEELIFKIEENKASILGGEKKEIDGVWKFIDTNKGIYMNDIPRRNCN